MFLGSILISNVLHLAHQDIWFNHEETTAVHHGEENALARPNSDGTAFFCCHIWLFWAMRVGVVVQP